MAAIAFDQQACAGSGPDVVADCIQQVYNQLAAEGPVAPQPEGGNFNFSYADIEIDGQTVSPYEFGCNFERCGFNQLGSLDYSHNDGAFHVDTANPLFFPIGTLLHLFVDVIGGNLPGWSNGGIPR